MIGCLSLSGTNFRSKQNFKTLLFVDYMIIYFYYHHIEHHSNPNAIKTATYQILHKSQFPIQLFIPISWCLKYNLLKSEKYIFFNVKKRSISLASHFATLLCVSKKIQECHQECVAKMCTTLECACQHPIWKMCHRQNLCQNALYNKGWYDQNRAAKMFSLTFV